MSDEPISSGDRELYKQPLEKSKVSLPPVAEEWNADAGAYLAAMDKVIAAARDAADMNREKVKALQEAIDSLHGRDVTVGIDASAEAAQAAAAALSDLSAAEARWGIVSEHGPELVAFGDDDMSVTVDGEKLFRIMQKMGYKWQGLPGMDWPPASKTPSLRRRLLLRFRRLLRIFPGGKLPGAI